MFAHLTTLFGVELAGIEIIFVHRGRVGQDIICCCDGLSTNRYIIRVHEIYVRVLA